MNKCTASLYEFSQTTMAVIAAYQDGDGELYSRVIETNGEQPIPGRPYHIMAANCRDNGASYRGREEGAKQLTNMQKKIPIVVSEALDLYAFPLISPRKAACSWLFLDHFQRVEDDGEGASLITFKNGEKWPLDVSPRIVDNGYKKALHLKHCFTQRIAEKRAAYGSQHIYTPR